MVHSRQSTDHGSPILDSELLFNTDESEVKGIQ